MKNKMKLISIVAVIMIVTFMLISTVYEVKASNPQSIIDGVNQAAGTADLGTTGDTLKTKAGTILAYIRNIAAIAGVIIISILGVKYIVGSVEQKAEYKKNFMPLIVGILIVVLATQIAKMLFSVFE